MLKRYYFVSVVLYYKGFTTNIFENTCMCVNRLNVPQMERDLLFTYNRKSPLTVEQVKVIALHKIRKREYLEMTAPPVPTPPKQEKEGDLLAHVKRRKRHDRTEQKLKEPK